MSRATGLLRTPVVTVLTCMRNWQFWGVAIGIVTPTVEATEHADHREIVRSLGGVWIRVQITVGEH